MIVSLLNSNQIQLGASFSDKTQVLKSAAGLLTTGQEHLGIRPDDVMRLLMEREELGSTGIGNGIAIPHAVLPGATQIAMALITVPQGVHFDSIDGTPVKAIFAMTAPAEQRSAHVRNLAELSRMVKDPGFLDKLVDAVSYEALLPLFQSTESGRSEVTTVEKSLLTAVIRKDEYLEPLLEVLAGVTDLEPTVFEGHGSGRYLRALPLFSMFWTDQEERTDAKVVTAVIDRHVGNETIRRIAAGVADPATEEGLLLTLQELALVTGTLGL